MYEKELYLLVEKFLKTQKNCLSDYTGTELSLKSGRSNIRVDVFGVSNEGSEKIIYLCEGKKELGRRSFGKVVGEAVELLKYGDYVYVFGSTEGFETEDREDPINKCNTLGIGILSVTVNEDDMEVTEVLKARRNEVKELNKKEVSLRVFIRGVNTPIADIVFQAAYEYINREQTNCVSFIDVCNSYFRDEKVKQMVRSVIGYHTLVDRDVRAEFQRYYGNAPYIRIEKNTDILDDTICFTEVGKKKGKCPILLGCVLYSIIICLEEKIPKAR